MGLHISLMNNEGDHKEWDFIRQCDDKKFPSLVGDFDIIEKRPEDIYCEDFRFKDTDEVRKAIENSNFEYKERYLHLIELMDADSSYWLNFSY